MISALVQSVPQLVTYNAFPCLDAVKKQYDSKKICLLDFDEQELFTVLKMTFT